MRNIDGKFRTDGNKIFNTVSGEEIPEDEPLFLLRGRDELARQTLVEYFKAAIDAGCNELHLEGTRRALAKFNSFALNHPERMKQPGVTRHLKLEDPA